MKRFTTLALVLALAAGAFAAAPASAGKKPVKSTFYLHGDMQAGEAAIPDTALNGLLMKMDETEPADPAPKSMFVTNYVGGPNTACSGNGILPVWKGMMAGTVKGDVTITLHTVSTPATKLNVELYPDGTGGCDSSLGSTGYVPPAAAQVVDVAPGPAETVVTLKGVNFKAGAWLILQLSIVGPHPGQVRVLYDSADFASNVTFTCVPKSGSKCPTA